MRSLTRRLLQRRDGATSIEYGLIVSLIFVAIVSALSLFGNGANGLFKRTMDAVQAAIG